MKIRKSKFAGSFRKTLLALSDPKGSFADLKKVSLEEAAADYLRMLIFLSALTGVFNFLFFVIRSTYLDIFVFVDVQYINMMNYALGRSSSLMLLYFFAGTFILFFISIILRIFIHKFRYAELMKVVLHSMAPFLMFGWLPSSHLALTVWSLFIFYIGTSNYKPESITKKSIRYRE